MTTTPAAFPVTITFPMHWGDMDALGHANNACFFRWFESARIACFARVGLGDAHTTGVGPILAHTECDYLAPLHWPADVVVGVRVTEIGRTSVAMSYAAWRADGAATVARGASVIVLVRYATGEKLPIGAELRAKLDALR